MADISTSIKQAPTYVADSVGGFVIERYLVDSQTSLGTISATGTHNIIPVSAGDLIYTVGIVVETAFAGATATVRWTIGSTNITGVITATDLATVGETIIAGIVPSVTATDGTTGFYVSADDTMDLIVATAALTAGKFIVEVIKTQNIFGANIT